MIWIMICELKKMWKEMVITQGNILVSAGTGEETWKTWQESWSMEQDPGPPKYKARVLTMQPLPLVIYPDISKYSE